jgi:FkbM family methyltransferase
LAKRFPDRAVLAIEPIPENFSVLKSIVERNKLDNVELVPVAVGEKKETLEMILPKNGKVKMQGLAHVVHDSIDEWNVGDKFEVLCERLDDVAGERKIAGIKMDVENFEYFALKGGEVMIDRDRPVIYLELWENKNRDLCFEFLRLKHYKIYVMLNGKLTPFDPASHKKQNFICKYEKERPVL